MSEDREGRPPEADPHVFDLDAAQFVPTGDPVLDRGLQLNGLDFEAAIADPDHPDHAAAKAAEAHFAEKYGDTFRRIGENLRAAFRPDLDGLFVAAKPRNEVRKSVTGAHTPELDQVELEIVEPTRDETPQKTLAALLELTEHMSEMVRVAAEHRDVALVQAAQDQAEALAARRNARSILILTWLALIGTWVAVVVALFK